MSEFSAEFWVATSIAVFLALVGIAVAVAMDAKTKGEFYAVIACFVLSAGITGYGIVSLDMTTKWVAFPRVLLFYGSIALVVALTGEAIRWAHGRHKHAYEKSAPSESSVAENPPKAPIVPLTDQQLKELIDKLRAGETPQSHSAEVSELNSDLRYVFYGKDRLRYVYGNPTKHAANKPTVYFGLVNLTNPYKYVASDGVYGPQPYPIPVKVMPNDYVRPGEFGGDEVMGQFASLVKPGDVIFGAAWITCINCKKRRAYYLYWKVGDGGWYSEVPLKGIELPLSDKPHTDLEIKEYVDKMVPFEKRKSIKQQFENPW